jgi:hypothetical protein
MDLTACRAPSGARRALPFREFAQVVRVEHVRCGVDQPEAFQPDACVIVEPESPKTSRQARAVGGFMADLSLGVAFATDNGRGARCIPFVRAAADNEDGPTRVARRAA